MVGRDLCQLEVGSRLGATCASDPGRNSLQISEPPYTVCARLDSPPWGVYAEHTQETEREQSEHRSEARRQACEAINEREAKPSTFTRGEIWDATSYLACHSWGVRGCDIVPHRPPGHARLAAAGVYGGCTGPHLHLKWAPGGARPGPGTRPPGPSIPTSAISAAFCAMLAW